MFNRYRFNSQFKENTQRTVLEYEFAHRINLRENKKFIENIFTLKSIIASIENYTISYDEITESYVKRIKTIVNQMKESKQDRMEAELVFHIMRQLRVIYEEITYINAEPYIKRLTDIMNELESKDHHNNYTDTFERASNIMTKNVKILEKFSENILNTLKSHHLKLNGDLFCAENELHEMIQLIKEDEMRSHDRMLRPGYY